MEAHSRMVSNISHESILTGNKCFSSGDIGVSASLILHGTPPFQVHYKMQRDNEPAQERSKIFSSSRGELTLQPEQSGHYNFAFAAMSDANYRRVELKGPSIDQIVHPLASADFVESVTGKKSVSSCAGDTVGVDVELRVCYELIYGRQELNFWISGD
jgi:nucleoporin POM152